MHPAPASSPAPAQTQVQKTGGALAARPRAAVLLTGVAATGTTVCIVALLLGGGRPETVPLGLPDPGALTGWALRLARLLGQLVAVLTVGSLMVGAALVPGGRGRSPALAPLARRAVRAGGGWAAAWAALATSAVLLTASDTAGVPLNDLDLSVLRAAGSTTQVRGLALTAAGAVAVAIMSGRVASARGCRGVLLVALASLLPTALTGHSASAVDTDIASTGLVVHVLAAAVWTGGLAGVLLHLRAAPEAVAVAVPRFSVLALVAYSALAGSGLITATTRLDPSLSAWTSGYGAIVAVKMALLVALGVLGHLHRRRSLPELTSGRTAPFLRLAAVELVIMGAALGLAAALTRTPVPPAPAALTQPAHGTGHPSLPGVVDPIALSELATAWRLDALVLVVLGVAVAAYAAGVRTLIGRGRTWPLTRSAAFFAGLLVALVDLCSGVATYAPAMVSVQVAQLLVAMLAVPALLLLGAPVTLWLRVAGLDGTGHLPGALTSPAARALTNPVVGAALGCALLVGVFRTPLIELSVRAFWVHLMVLSLAVVSGLVLLWPVLGVDPVPEPRGLVVRGWCVLAVVASLVLLAVQLRYGDRLLAGDWFLELRWGWVDPVADQRLAGAIVGAAAVATVVLLAVAALSRRRATS